MNLRVIDRDNDDIIGLTAVRGHSSAQFPSLAARSVSTRDVRRLMSAQMCADVYASHPCPAIPAYCIIIIIIIGSSSLAPTAAHATLHRQCA